MDLSPLYTAIDSLIAQKGSVLLAIDGPCASGKSTLADELGNRYSAPVLRMDDFFLPPEKRTEERLSQPGGNVDSDRFVSEVLNPLVKGIPFTFRPWHCKTGMLGEEISISPSGLTIVEGAYALRPDLRDFYHLRVFLTAPLPLRLERIRHRNGQEGLAVFQSRWIPLEDAYFEACGVEDCCEVTLSF